MYLSRGTNGRMSFFGRIIKLLHRQEWWKSGDENEYNVAHMCVEVTCFSNRTDFITSRINVTLTWTQIMSSICDFVSFVKSPCQTYPCLPEIYFFGKNDKDTIKLEVKWKYRFEISILKISHDHTRHSWRREKKCIMRIFREGIRRNVNFVNQIWIKTTFKKWHSPYLCFAVVEPFNNTYLPVSYSNSGKIIHMLRDYASLMRLSA